MLIVLVFKTDFLNLAGKTLGWLPPEEWSLQLCSQILEQAKADAGVRGGATILLGDSLIAELDPKDVADDAVNFGLVGDTTNTLYARLPVLRSVTQSRTVIVGVGVNDLKYRSGEQIAHDYASVLDRLSGVPHVLILSVLPVDANGEAALRRPYLRNGIIAAVNRDLRDVCQQRANCRFLDAWPTMTASAPGVYGSDGWHLSATGRKVLADFLRHSLLSE